MLLNNGQPAGQWSGVENIFRAVQANCSEGFISICSLPPGSESKDLKKAFFNVSSTSEAVDYARRLNVAGHNVFYSLGVLGAIPKKGRGSEQDVISIGSVWIDLDFGREGHQASNYPPNLESAMELVQESYPGLLPSLIVNSGNGAHLYWFFKQPWLLREEVEREKATSFIKRFQAAIKMKVQARGWKIDSTADLARILRIPGSLNYKSNPPKQGHIVSFDQNIRYGIEDFYPYLRAEALSNGSTNKKMLTTVCDGQELVVEGQRNNYITSKTGTMLRAGLTKAAALEAIREENRQRIRPQLPDEEIVRTVESVYRYGRDESLEDKLIRAKAFLDEILKQVREDEMCLFEDETIQALALVRKYSRDYYIPFKLKLKRMEQVDFNDLEDLIEEWARKNRHLFVDDNKKENNFLEQLGHNFSIPKGYDIRENGVFRSSEHSQVPVISAPIFISKNLSSLASGRQKIELSYYINGQLKKNLVEKEVVANKSKIIELASYGLPIHSENAREVVKYLSAFEDVNRGKIPVTKTFNRLGWINSQEFLPGLSDTFLDVENGNKQLADAFTEKGDLSQWIELVSPLRETAIARFVLSAGFAAPLMEKVGQRIFMIHLWGNSRSGKSALAKAALSAWANPSEGMMTFNTTKVGLEQQVSFLHNLPLVIDEKQIVSNNQQFAENIIYMLGEGKGKTRGTKGGGLAEHKTWKTLAIATGEHPVSADNSTTGVKTRTLELHCNNVVGGESYGSKLHRELEGVHGVAGPAFLKHVLEYDDLIPLYKDLEAKISTSFPNLLGSYHSALALLVATDALVSQFIFGLEEETAVFQAVAMLQQIVKLLETKEEADEATRAYDYLVSWVQQHEPKFDSCSNSHEKYGLIEADKKLVHIFPNAFTLAIEQAGFNNKRARMDFAERGWLIKNSTTNEKTTTKNIDGINKRVITIKLPD